jgi:hypothetical protein
MFTNKKSEFIYYKTKSSEKIRRTKLLLNELSKWEKYNEIVFLNCSGCRLEVLCELPIELEELNCSYNKIKMIEKIPNTLRVLRCSYNQIKNLIDLPNELRELYCYNNKIIFLNNLPDELRILVCCNNKIWSLGLGELPPKLEVLDCWGTWIYKIRKYPIGLKKLFLFPIKGKKLIVPYTIEIVNGREITEPNILDGYVNKHISLEQLINHFNMIEDECVICKGYTRCINRCQHSCCIDCVIDMYKIDERTECCICGKSLIYSDKFLKK